MTTVYKVVRRRRDGKLASAIIRRGPLVVIYQIDKPSLPISGTKLLAFDSLENALTFRVGRPKSVEVWEASAPNPRYKEFITGCWVGLKRIREFWASPNSCYIAPPGTVACDSITLIKCVDGPE